MNHHSEGFGLHTEPEKDCPLCQMLWRSGFGHYHPAETHQHSLDAVWPEDTNGRRLLDAYTDTGPFNAVITGPAGTGKTLLANYLAIINHQDKQLFTNYMRASEIINMSAVAYCQVRATDNNVLIIDELCAHRYKSHERAVLQELIDGRYTWNNITIVITNLTLADLTDEMGEKFTSRLLEKGHCLSMLGENRRLS